MKTLEKLSFKSKVDMMAYIKGLTADDHAKILELYALGADNADHAQSLASYIIQGIFLKKTGNDLTEYAITQAEKRTATAATVAVGKVASDKVVKVAKVAKVKKESKPRVKYGDFEIVARPDRGGWEGWYAGKAEAFRTTVDKVNAFFEKKYKATGVVVPAKV